MSAVTLLMAVHSHQPVGNFGFVFEEAYAKAYEPFLSVLERHPGVQLALHYSGCLLDWLLEHRPAFLERVRRLVAAGQVELLASGYYEPILPLIPEADRQGQIALMRQALRRHLGADAEGLWLTERVWEPELPSTLASAGIRYTMVDANQFAGARAWLPNVMQVQDEVCWDLLGSYATSYGGASVVLFPASKRLRYSMPFQAVDRTVEFLRRLQRDEPVAITFADDGEKFGLWPNTSKWVYEEGWLDTFFGALERERSWLRTMTFRDYVNETPPCGTVWLPCGSYEEMLEWSGGSFRNFFMKYPEANAMLQKMLSVSRQLQQVESSDSQLLAQARRELYTGQCNCAYWHGVFGGLYLAHLRRAVYAHLLAAEDLTGQAAHPRQAAGPARGVTRMSVEDLDGDGREEVRFQTPAMNVVVDPAEGGAVTEWSLYQARVNLLDTLSRRQEPYHEKLRSRQTPAAASTTQGVASIHDMLGVKEEHLESYLAYDDHRRSAFLDYALQSLPRLQDVVRSAWGEQRLWSAGSYQVEPSPSGKTPPRTAGVLMTREVAGRRIRKTVQCEGARPVVRFRYDLDGGDVPVIALEFNVSLRDERFLKQSQQAARVGQFEIVEEQLGMSLRLAVEPAATLYQFPIETVSESESGLERTYQGLCLLFLWELSGARSWTARVDCSVVNI